MFKPQNIFQESQNPQPESADSYPKSIHDLSFGDSDSSCLIPLAQLANMHIAPTVSCRSSRNSVLRSFVSDAERRTVHTTRRGTSQVVAHATCRSENARLSTCNSGHASVSSLGCSTRTDQPPVNRHDCWCAAQKTSGEPRKIVVTCRSASDFVLSYPSTSERLPNEVSDIEFYDE